MATDLASKQVRYAKDSGVLVTREAQRRGAYMLNRYFPDCTPTCRKLRGGFISTNKLHHRDAAGHQLYCRVLYPKHIALMDASAIHRETGMIAGNRVGKSDIGAYSTTCHMTGLYPHWWRGRRFKAPVAVWAAGDTGKTTRNIIQEKLLGVASSIGTGFIPAHLIVAKTKKSGIANAYEMLWVRHVPTGKVSTIELKCHPAGSRVWMSSGEWRAIEKVQLGDVVRLFDGSTRRVAQLHAYQDAPVLTVSTRAGEFAATPNHLVPVSGGVVGSLGPPNARWVRVDELREGDVVGVRSPELDAELRDSGDPQPEWRLKLTALMIGDGCMRGATPTFVTDNPALLEEVKRALSPIREDLHLVEVKGWKHAKTYKLSGGPNANILTRALRDDGLWGHKSVDKWLPPWVYRMPLVQRRMFLRWLWGCDGSMSDRSANYYTSSLELAKDVRLLLWSVGIYAPVRTHQVSCNGKPFVAYYISLYGENRIAFEDIGKLGKDTPLRDGFVPRTKGPPGEVMSVNPAARSDVFCVGVEGDEHEIVVDGFRVGNSYDQRRESFQGTAQHVIWLDEEPPMDIYAECLLRTTKTSDFPGGMILLTFTPLQGRTVLVKQFLADAVRLDTNE